MSIRIIDYSPSFQPKIDKMMGIIQTGFSELITTSHSTVIQDVYRQDDQRFWIALAGPGDVAGTVGVKLAEDFAEIKRMFVDPAYRGPVFATAKMLLNTAVDFASAAGRSRIFLGTMAQFVAAQKFYEKSGFRRIKSTELPEGYRINPMDTIFYTLD